MERDPTVFLLGEEVAQYQGAYKVWYHSPWTLPYALRLVNMDDDDDGMYVCRCQKVCGKSSVMLAWSIHPSLKWVSLAWLSYVTHHSSYLSQLHQQHSIDHDNDWWIIGCCNGWFASYLWIHDMELLYAGTATMMRTVLCCCALTLTLCVACSSIGYWSCGQQCCQDIVHVRWSTKSTHCIPWS